MAEAVVGAGSEIAPLAGEPRVARAAPIVAVLVIQASTFAPLERTVKPHEAQVAHAGPVHALAVPGAFVGAGADRAVGARVAKLAVARGVVADTLVAAVVGTGLERAVITRPPRFTHTHSHVEAGPRTGAGVGTLRRGTVSSRELWVAHARPTHAVPLVVAVGRAGQVRAGLAGEANFTVARSIEAVPVVAAVTGAGVERAIVTREPVLALAREVVPCADTVTGAIVWAHLV